jgi:hypothetical protein
VKIDVRVFFGVAAALLAVAVFAVLLALDTCAILFILWLVSGS